MSNSSPPSGRSIQVSGKFRHQKKLTRCSCVSKAAVRTGQFFPITSGIKLCYKKKTEVKIFSELRDQFTYFWLFFENLAQTSGLGLLRPHILNQAQMVIFTWKTQFSSYNVPVPDSLPPWRHCECSKYVFYIVEGYTMALKKSRVKNIFSSWRKLIFKKIKK